MNPPNRPPPLPLPVESAESPAPGKQYQTIADTIGFVPSMRKADNRLQLWIFLGFALVGGIAGIIVVFATATDSEPATLNKVLIVALVAGFLLGTAGVFISGLVLAIVNLTRAGKTK